MSHLVEYVEIDNTSLVTPVDADHITIEGADVEVGAVKVPKIHINDYLGIGTPDLYR